MSTRIKICGITRAEDARAAADSGADVIGLVFYAPSPRAVTAEQAADIVEALPPFVGAVGLFVDAPRAEIEAVLASVPLDMLQFHGDEEPEFCGSFRRPWLKALRMREDLDLAQAAQRYGDARALLLDAYREGVPGGTGETFDWGLIANDLQRPIVLAGGLNPANVMDAVTSVAPAAVDVSGGVEASPGIKDHQKVQQFIAAVRAADNHRKT